MLESSTLLLAVPVLPLIGAVLCSLFGGVKELKPWTHLPAVVCAALSCACAVAIVHQLMNASAPVEYPLGQGQPTVWFGIGYENSKLFAHVSLSADQLAGVM